MASEFVVVVVVVVLSKDGNVRINCQLTIYFHRFDFTVHR